MKSSARFFLHPVLAHPRSRAIFLGYLAFAAAVAVVVWFEMNSLLADVVPRLSDDPSPPLFLKSLLSVPVQAAIVMVAAAVGAALTARYVVGPIKRMQAWLIDWQEGRPVKPLRVRAKDKFSTLAALINEVTTQIGQPRS